MNPRTKYIPVRLSGRAEGTEDLSMSVEPSDIHLPAEFASPLVVLLHLDVSHDQIVLRVDVRGEAVYPCDRCLDPVRLPVDTRFYLVYTNSGNSDVETDADEVRMIDHNDPVADLADDVRDAAMLCIPMRKTCGEDEHGSFLCRTSIPDHLNADVQEKSDPRWDALKSLKL
jgi:uncharacterized metal-binding protein YceD (DUF177 family)